MQLLKTDSEQGTPGVSGDPERWLSDFHAGDRATLEACYRQHFLAVAQSVGRVLQGADAETVVHEVFFRLLTSEELRRNFKAGSLGAWLSTVARNQATDHRRRRARESPFTEGTEDAATPPHALAEELDAKRIIERFRREILPEKWARVFETRFIEQQDQRTAAQAIGISRTTLAYQEMRLRGLLRRYLLKMESP